MSPCNIYSKIKIPKSYIFRNAGLGDGILTEFQLLFLSPKLAKYQSPIIEGGAGVVVELLQLYY